MESVGMKEDKTHIQFNRLYKKHFLEVIHQNLKDLVSSSQKMFLAVTIIILRICLYISYFIIKIYRIE